MVNWGGLLQEVFETRTCNRHEEMSRDLWSSLTKMA